METLVGVICRVGLAFVIAYWGTYWFLKPLVTASATFLGAS